MTLPTSIDLTDFLGIAGLVVVAGASIWAVRRAIGLLGR